MKKMVRAVLFAVMSVFFTAVFAEASCEKPANLTEIDGVYRIGTCGDLYKFAEMVNNGQPDINGMLTADISVNVGVLTSDGTLNGDGSNFKQWTPIGTDYKPFAGIFDGDGHTISGLYFNNKNTDNVGLFGYIDENSKVQNVGVVDSYFEGNDYVGGVVGYNEKGFVSNAYNTGTVIGQLCVGGVVGNNEDEGFVSNVYNAGSVSGSTYVGGVVGYNKDGRIEIAYNTGKVKGEYGVGGVVGYNTGPVRLVYNTGAVKGESSCLYIGGVIGYNSASGYVMSVYSTSLVVGSKNAGGVVGYNEGSVQNVYYNKDFYTGNAVGENKGGKIDNAEGKTTAELASTTLPEGFSSENWKAGSGEEPDIKNGKLVYKLPGLKNVGSQPEIENPSFRPNAEGFYEISNAQELKWFAQLVNGGATDIKGKLTADICLNACDEGDKPLLEQIAELEAQEKLLPESFEQWTPIGTESKPYTGIFDGAGFTISGLYFNDGNADYVGLFGNIYYGAKVQNVGVVDSYFVGRNSVGGVVGWNDGTVSNVYNTGAVSGENQVGGVVGENEGDLSNVYNTGVVSGTDNVGGVVGRNTGFVSYVYNTGSVSGSFYVGGVVGSNRGTVSNVYNTGVVSGTDNVGGVVGRNTGFVSYVYNTGSVSGSGLYVGGVVGSNVGLVSNVYYNTEVSCKNCSPIIGTFGKTTAELVAGTSLELDTDVWVLGGVGVNAKQDSLYYPYLKVMGPGAYVLSDVKKYTVTVAVNDETMGTVSGAGEYEYGAEVELSAVANEGYRFTDWEDDVKNAVRTITVTKNETYTANFEAIPSSSSEAESSSSEAASSSSEDESSSSEAESSSSEAESSSSEAESSSSEAESSSSEEESSSSEAESSSSEAESSSSEAESSSSEAGSSSSAAASSSSDAKSSSSSAKSSSSKAASSSSDAKSSSSSAKSSSSSAKSSSSAATSSSSEAKSSSSSAKSSSSSAKSSSSEAGSSSSDAESSSSEVGSSSSDAKSSSSDAKSSSSQKESVIARAALPQFSVTASGKIVSIAGARPNSVVNVFDMQGNLVKTVVTTAANLTFTLPSAGVYIVKNGYTAKRVNVR